MELKHRINYIFNHLLFLLIVPYGIETQHLEKVFFAGIGLLIVPYGIETLKMKIEKNRKQTFNRTLWN